MLVVPKSSSTGRARKSATPAGGDAQRQRTAETDVPEPSPAVKQLVREMAVKTEDVLGEKPRTVIEQDLPVEFPRSKSPPAIKVKPNHPHFKHTRELEQLQRQQGAEGQATGYLVMNMTTRKLSWRTRAQVELLSMRRTVWLAGVKVILHFPTGSHTHHRSLTDTSTGSTCHHLEVDLEETLEGLSEHISAPPVDDASPPSSEDEDEHVVVQIVDTCPQPLPANHCSDGNAIPNAGPMTGHAADFLQLESAAGHGDVWITRTAMENGTVFDACLSNTLEWQDETRLFPIALRHSESARVTYPAASIRKHTPYEGDRGGATELKLPHPCCIQLRMDRARTQLLMNGVVVASWPVLKNCMPLSSRQRSVQECVDLWCIPDATPISTLTDFMWSRVAVDTWMRTQEYSPEMRCVIMHARQLLVQSRLEDSVQAHISEADLAAVMAGGWKSLWPGALSLSPILPGTDITLQEYVEKAAANKREKKSLFGVALKTGQTRRAFALSYTAAGPEATVARAGAPRRSPA